MPILSLIIPCHNESQNIEPLYQRIKHVMGKITNYVQNYELVFVDDGSLDTTLVQIKQLAATDNKIRYISFTRNFGKEAAMLAGLRFAVGDYVAILDADMQDPPELLEKMLFFIMTDSTLECVASHRTTRTGEPFLRSLFAHFFYKLVNTISNVEIVNGARDFRIMSRKMVNSILSLKEKSRFSKGLFVWAGYKTHYLGYENPKRIYGKSKWSFWQLFKYSLDGIISFSVVPLQLASVGGILMCLISFAAIMFFVIQKLTIGIAVQGYALMICAIFFLGGIQLLSIGILGQYLGKIFIECKRRPDFIVLDTNILSDDMENINKRT